MVVEYIRYKISQAESNKFIESYKLAAVALSRSKFCKGYELSRCTEEKDLFTLRILWTSETDHMSGFRQSPEFREFFIHIKGYVGNILEMQHYELTDVRSER